MICRRSPSNLASPIGQYSHLAVVPADYELVLISGQVGVLEDSSLAGMDAEAQSLAVAQALAAPELTVEIEAIAAIPPWSPLRR